MLPLGMNPSFPSPIEYQMRNYTNTQMATPTRVYNPPRLSILSEPLMKFLIKKKKEKRRKEIQSWNRYIIQQKKKNIISFENKNLVGFSKILHVHNMVH